MPRFPAAELRVRIRTIDYQFLGGGGAQSRCSNSVPATTRGNSLTPVEVAAGPTESLDVWRYLGQNDAIVDPPCLGSASATAGGSD